MATESTKDVELRIRARDYSQKTFKELGATLKTLTRLQEDQTDAADRGEAKAKDLQATYTRLEEVGRQLLKMDALTKTWERQAAALEEAKNNAEQARIKQAALAAEIAKSEKVTKKQEAALRSATGAVVRAEKAEQGRQQALARTSEQMERYGIDTNRVANAQAILASQVGKVNLALERQDRAIENLPANTQAAAIRQQEAAARQASLLASQQAAAQAYKQAAAQREAAQSVINALQRQADQAVASSKGYGTLGRVVRDVSADQQRLGQTILGIIAPAEAARKSLAGVEKQVDDLDKEITAAGKSIKDGAAKLRELAAAQKALLGSAQGLDKYQQQIAAVRSARSAYVAARAELQNLAAQTRQTGVDAEAMGNKIKQAQAKVAQAGSALRQAAQDARNTQGALRQAGINTAKLADEEARLVSTANRATSSAQRLTAALKEQSKTTGKGADLFRLLSENGRQSLSVIQRIRGEVLALATAFVGVQGAITLAGGAVDAFKARQQALIKISTVVGDSAAAQNSEWEYMVGLANKLGINLDVIATSYTKFAVASNAVGNTLQETKFIFENIAKAGRVFALSADDMNGVFRALEQMLSKGQVYAEELRGQLGERLPGAVATFAKAMGMSIQEVTKQLELGNVTAKEVINFSREQGAAVYAQLEAADRSIGAVEARLQNAMFLFKLAIADSGFIDAYSRALVKLTEFLNSPDGAQAAQSLGEGFSALAEALIWCVDNIDLLVGAFKVLLGLKIGSLVIGLGTKLGVLVKALIDVRAKAVAWTAALSSSSGAVGALGIALRGLMRLVPLVGGLLLAWDIGKIMYEQSQTFREAVDTMALYLNGFRNLLATLTASMATGIEDLSRLLFRSIHQMGTDAAKAIAEQVAGILRLIPKVGEGLAQSVDDWAAGLDGPEGEFVSKTQALWDQLGKDWKAMQEEMTDKQRMEAEKRAQIEYAEARRQAESRGTGFEFTADPGTGPDARSRQIDTLTKAFEKLEDKAKKADIAAQKALMRKNLPGRLALIDQEFAPQMEQAKALGGPEGAALVARLEKIIALRKKAETDQFQAQTAGAGQASTEKRVKQLEQLSQEYEKLAATVARSATKVDPTTPFTDRLAAQLEVVNVQYDKLIAKANKLGGTEGKRLAQQFEGLRKTNLEIETQRMRLEELDRLEKAATTQINIKRAGIEEINSLREAGLISEDEQVRRVNELYAAQNAEIGKAITALEQYAMTMASSMTPEQLALINAEIAKMRAGLQDVSGTYTKMDTLIVNGVLDGMLSGVEAVAEGIAGIIDGTMTMGDAWSNLGDVIRQFFADFLMQIAKAILQQMILNALAGFGGPIGGAASAAGGVAAGVAHDGAVVGSGSMNRTRSAPATWFANAPRMHTGGVVGLAPDEVPTILQKGEEVLSAGDPRNVMNGGGSTGGANVTVPGPVIYNMLDQDELAQAVMSNPATGSATVNIIRSNRKQIKQILGIG